MSGGREMQWCCVGGSAADELDGCPTRNDKVRDVQKKRLKKCAAKRKVGGQESAGHPGAPMAASNLNCNAVGWNC